MNAIDYFGKEKQIWESMQQRRAMALRQLSKLLPYYTDQFAIVLAYAYLEGCTTAENLAHGCDLEQIDFFAILEDEPSFFEKWEEEQEYLREQSNDD